MKIYDDVTKKYKIAIFSMQNDILDKVLKVIPKEDCYLEKYDKIDEVIENIEKENIKIIILGKCSTKDIERIKNIKKDTIVIALKSDDYIYQSSNIKNIVGIEDLNFEIIKALDLVAYKEDYKDFKLDIVGNLIDSISHQIQANLLLVSASLDVIKMLNEDERTEKNKEKREILENLYSKNSQSLQKANLLLQLMSNAANVSGEAIMKYTDIIEMLNLILENLLKENEVTLNIKEKIKENAYICGPLNDVIFIICKIIKQLIINKEKVINLNIYEDENKWYFSISSNKILKNIEKLSQIEDYIIYVKDILPRIKEKELIIELAKS